MEIDEGSIVVIRGPSGCGKTTTLRLIAGLDKPNSGRILFDDTDVTHLSPRDRNVAMVFQTNALYPHLTVQRNIEFPLRMRKVAKSEWASRIQSIATSLEISNLLGRRIDQLSGGQQRRVAIARALVRRPAVTLLDEPLTSLDESLKERVLKAILDIHQQALTTLVYVTHDSDEASILGEAENARIVEFDSIVRVGN